MIDYEAFLQRCEIGDELRVQVRVVLRAMPASVVEGLTGDEAFVLSEWDNTVRGPSAFAVPSPGRKPVRAVVLKRRMWRRDDPFVQWVIAHELAHAHLQNRGRFPGEDPEAAADALAAEWGFRRP